MVKEELIDPKGEEERKKAGLPKDPKKSDFAVFGKALEKARELHDIIQDKYHDITYPSTPPTRRSGRGTRCTGAAGRR